MATMITGLGGPAGYGEQSFRTSAISGNLDDGFVNVNVTSVFGAGGMNINETSYTSMFISSNGLITFASGVTSYTPTSLTSLGQPSLAPFWTDADINKGGEIYWDLDPTTGKITVTWANVAAFQGPGTNSFQVVITATGGGDFAVEYIYQSIGYTNGYAGHATTGLSNGVTQVLLEGSGDPALLSTYSTNDFDTNSPVGVYGLGFEGGSSFVGDGIVDGTTGNDLINTAYTGDPNGDRVDAGDATGFGGTTGDGDYIRAGAGNDTVIAGLGNDVIFGGDGEDSIQGGYGADTVDGGIGNDTIDGASGNDSLEGGAGDDVITGGAAGAAITYTPTYFEILGSTVAVAGSGGRPNFSVQSVSNENDLTSSISSTAGTNGTLTGFRIGNGDSNETHTHTASSQIAGGQIRFNGLDTTELATIRIDGVTINLNTAIANGSVTFNGAGFYAINGAGQIGRAAGSTSINPTTIGTLTINIPYTSLAIVGSGTNTTTTSGLFYEYLVNTQPLNVAAEAGGNDTLSGGAGNDVLSGGDGNDLLAGGDDNDQLFGGTGNDNLSGDLGNDTLQGEDGDDTLAGGGGADSLVGGIGNDSLLGDGGADTLFGGDGNDRLFGGADNDSLSGDLGNDTLQGDDGDDTLSGGDGVDSLLGGVGSDVLFGGVGTDALFGGDGNDTLSGGADADVLDGGSGFDVADYSASATGVTINLQTGLASGGDAQGDTLTGIEGVIGSSANDALTAGASGGTLFGGSGNDTLQGGAGNDRLEGGDGNDLLEGGDGADTLFGGAGDDTIRLTGVGDVVDGGESAGDNDVLDLSNWGWRNTNILYDPGSTQSGIVQFLDSNGAILGSMQFSNFETVIPCFTPGTLITTRRGEVAVETLRAGDEVLTRDNSYRALVWMGHRKLTAADLIANPQLRPVRIAAGALGAGLPRQDMLVSPQHRMLIEGARAEMLFGEAEVLVAALHLVGLPGIETVFLPGLTYVHIMFEDHEIVCADGAWSESFQPAQRMLSGMEADQAEEIRTLFPELAQREIAFASARLTLKAYEARVLLAA